MEIITRRYTSMLDVFSFIGGNYTILTALFIGVPTAIWFNRDFITKYTLKRIREIEKIKNPRTKISEEQLKRKYFYRISHTSIYSLFDKVQDLQKLR